MQLLKRLVLFDDPGLFLAHYAWEHTCTQAMVRKHYCHSRFYHWDGFWNNARVMAPRNLDDRVFHFLKVDSLLLPRDLGWRLEPYVNHNRHSV
jgi:hypothetical protein